jgi:esterase/lipase superfamily enzyme
MRRENPGTHETLLFVHGYNNTLSEAMYRLAQIQTDFDTGMPGVLFSWPSAGDPRGYIYDRDSVLFARDDLTAVLRQLTSGPGDKVFLLAHSMGSSLVMETGRPRR